MTQPIPTRGAHLAYSTLGSGPITLYAHGLTASRRANARASLPDFTPVSQHTRLISYDARAHGESTGTPNPTDYTWPCLAEDLLALADHFSPTDPISAIGLSMGTGTLLHAAVQHPHRFTRLILTAPPTAWETRIPQRALYAQLSAFAENNSPEALRKLFSSTPPAPIFADVPDYASQPDIDPALLPTVFRGAGLTDLPAPEQLRALTQPTLILAWATDPGHPVSTAQKLAELLPHAQLHVSETSQDIRTWGARAAAFLAR